MLTQRGALLGIRTIAGTFSGQVPHILGQHLPQFLTASSLSDTRSFSDAKIVSPT
ncbi:hypothetical protein PGT21_024804 [Puccinia graminis f. sp. tritici]|uniref:Uncharacterized protein n=1 Tax=Puccinia graminis f. sp. tritici TaxID=56615 RepID=A0A5B0MTR6_PUCGR|nr:hypothetical protein PGT21_024804 [Puccinia graminis f. sp. tritici]